MFIKEAIILGILQGLTEFLPISSSAHLVLLPKLLGWEVELLNSLAFDVALHFGTLLAVLIYFCKDLVSLFKVFFQVLKKPTSFMQNSQARLIIMLFLGTLPAVVVAVLFKSWLTTVFRAPILVSVSLGIGALLMILAEKVGRKKRELTNMKISEALLIGLSQALALMPGVSRSGITITMGLALGFKREQAARFTFLLSIPAILGAVIFESKALFELAPNSSFLITIVLGVLSSTLIGYLCIKFLLQYLQKHSLYIFVIYRLFLAVIILGWIFLFK